MNPLPQTGKGPPQPGAYSKTAPPPRLAGDPHTSKEKSAAGALKLDADGGVQSLPACTSCVARSVYLGAFADGAMHTFEFVYSNPDNGGKSNFNLDDVTLECTASGN